MKMLMKYLLKGVDESYVWHSVLSPETLVEELCRQVEWDLANSVAIPELFAVQCAVQNQIFFPKPFVAFHDSKGLVLPKN